MLRASKLVVRAAELVRKHALGENALDCGRPQIVLLLSLNGGDGPVVKRQWRREYQVLMSFLSMMRV